MISYVTYHVALIKIKTILICGARKNGYEGNIHCKPRWTWDEVRRFEALTRLFALRCRNYVSRSYRAVTFYFASSKRMLRQKQQVLAKLITGRSLYMEHVNKLIRCCGPSARQLFCATRENLSAVQQYFFGYLIGSQQWCGSDSYEKYRYRRSAIGDRFKLKIRRSLGSLTRNLYPFQCLCHLQLLKSQCNFSICTRDKMDD